MPDGSSSSIDSKKRCTRSSMQTNRYNKAKKNGMNAKKHNKYFIVNRLEAVPPAIKVHGAIEFPMEPPVCGFTSRTKMLIQ